MEPLNSWLLVFWIHSFGQNKLIPYHKTRIWTLFQRRRGRGGTSRWLSSSRRAWTHRDPPGRFKETETLRKQTLSGGWSLKKKCLCQPKTCSHCPHLCDVGEADDEGDEADDEDEDLLPLPQLHGILVHEGGDEALHRAELRHCTKQRWAAAAVSVLISHHAVGCVQKQIVAEQVRIVFKLCFFF